MSSGFKKALFLIFAFLFFFIFLPVIFYFATYPLVPRYFATQDLQNYILDFEKRAEELSEEEPTNCDHFVEERDEWRSNFHFLANYGSPENIDNLFDRSWEAERECLYSIVNSPNAFISTYRHRLFNINTDITNFKDEIDIIIDSYDKELSYYFQYKRAIDEDIDARKDFYDCRIEVSENFDYSKFYEALLDENLDTEDFDFSVLDEGFEECERDFEEKIVEIYTEYEILWDNIFKERDKRYFIFQELKEEMGME